MSKFIIPFTAFCCLLWVGATVGILASEMPNFTVCAEEVEELAEQETEVLETADFGFDEVPQMTGFGYLMDDLEAGDLDELLEEPETTTDSETVSEKVEPWEVVEARIPYVTYGVDGQYMDENVYEALVTELRRRGIEWWLPYAVCEAYQESRFDMNAKATHGSGFDCGLFQYYDRYWDSKCKKYGLTEWPNGIFDPIAQVYIYACEFSERLGSGASIEQTLSDHYTGGQGYYEQYVVDVLQWVDHLTTK